MAGSIAVDAMGGDVGPSVTVPSTLSVIRETKDVDFVLVGDQEAIQKQLVLAKAEPSDKLQVMHAPEIVEMNDSPTYALRRKKQSSMRIALDLVKSGEVKACVSAGNTGALMAIALFVLRTFPGIYRPAIIGQVPTVTGACAFAGPGRQCRVHLRNAASIWHYG